MIARDAAIAGYEEGRIHIQHLSARESVAAVAEAKARGVRITAEASPHHLTLTHDAIARAARHAAEDEPAAALRGRPAGADRGPARRDDRLHRHRPRAARARGEGGAVRGGADGHDRAGDRVRRGLHRARASRACCRSALVVEKLSAGAALLGLRDAADRGRRAGRAVPDRPRRRSGRSARPATSRARRTAASPAARCAAACSPPSRPARSSTGSGRSP